MADNFFGFNTELPSSVLGRKGLNEEFLTDDVEDEYDALNDETFGQATADDDWEEAHEKLSELITRKDDLVRNSVFNDSLLEGDESQNEIVTKSISQLGLEDDLDDPAIMTVARNCHSLAHLRSSYRSASPPPPAILETEDCGSPKTHSIWSTTPKDSGISSFLQSINPSSSSIPHKDTPMYLNSTSDNVFITPTKAWRAEELEKDLLSTAKKEPIQTSSGSWPQVPSVLPNNHQNAINKISSPRFPNNLGQNRNKIAVDRMLTREEVERHLHSDMRMRFPGGVPNFPPPQLIPPALQSSVISPIGSSRGNSINGPNQSSPVPLRPIRGPMIGNNPVPDRFFINARMNMMHNQLPLRGPMPNLPPGFNPSNLGINHSKLLSLPPRSIAHPLLNKHFQFPLLVYNSYYENEDGKHMAQEMEDEYAGLMTQKEKEWLKRIQMLQLKSENPYVEDYYFTTQVARRCRKKYDDAPKNGGDAPEVILPQTTKHESRTFVPTQFEGSLGKLQAVSVNFPRKVLDITVTRPLEDEEGKVVTNQSLLRYRRLLLDIEKLYCYLLEIEDEERRILAKPESESGQHLVNIAKLTKDIFTGLFNESDDYFQNIMTIRKGRSLVMRVFKIFNVEQQVQCLVFLLQYLPLILKKDFNDHILVQNIEMFSEAIQKFSLTHLVKLGETLNNSASPEPTKMKEKGNFINAFKNKFGSSVVCAMLMRAEALYCGFDLFETDIQNRWLKVIKNVVECLCTVSNSSLAAPVIPCKNLLSHFQRFPVDKDKLDLLQEKLEIFVTNSKLEDVKNV